MESKKVTENKTTPGRSKRGDNDGHQERESFKSWSDMWKFAIKNNLGYDTILKVGPQEVAIPCHKIVLMIHSEVFEAMFCRWGKDGCKETEDNMPVVRLLDDDAEIFKVLLKFFYIYSKSHPSDQSFQYTALQLLKVVALARKYLMPFPLQEAIMLLTSRKKLVNAGNVIELYENAKILKDSELEKFFEEEILLRAFCIFKTEKIFQFTHDSLIYFLKKDDLNCNEIQIFQGCLRWAEHQCGNQNLPATSENLNKTLGDAIKFIRFPVLSLDNLLSNVKGRGIISDSEIVEIICYKKRTSLKNKFFNRGKDGQNGEVSVLPFITEPRDRAISLERFRRNEENFTLDFEQATCISFEVDRSIKLNGVGFFGAERDCKLKIDVKVKFRHEGDEKIVAYKTEDIEYTSKCSSPTATAKNVFPVYFPNPVTIMANKKYFIVFTIQGAKTFYASKVQYVLEHETHRGKVRFKFHSIKANKSAAHYGQMAFMYYRLPSVGKKDADAEVQD